MKRTILPLGLAVLTAMDVSAATKVMTYQGRLKESSIPVTGTRQVNIYLCNALTGGTCTPTGEQAVVVTNALFRTTFTVPGSVDLESGRWYLEVRLGAGGTTTLVPREELTASPYAVMATSATTVAASGVRAGTMVGVNTSGNAGTASALAANPANCAAGNAPLGVDASGAVESCYDVGTQTELDTHTNATSAHSATNANTASRIVMRDASGNFSAGTITAALTGNAATATSLAADPGDCVLPNVALGINAVGNATCAQPSNVTGNAATATNVAATGVTAGTLATSVIAQSVRLQPATKATLLATAPSGVGEAFVCSDCGPRQLVFSTGVAAGNFAAADGGPFGATESAIPTGAVMFFNLAVCPTGWTELTAARGRYLVGLPAAGTLAGTAGTALTDLENRAVGQHSHGVTDPAHSHDIRGAGGGAVFNPTGSTVASATGFTTGASVTGISINNAGTVAGTNAPYIQLLICSKD